MKMLVENADDQRKADPGLLRIVARVRDIQERLMQKSGLTLHAIASQEHVTPGYVSRLLRLSSLAPDIITAIVKRQNPPQVTAKKLMRLALEIPVELDRPAEAAWFSRTITAPLRVRRPFNRRAFAASCVVPPSSPNWKVDPQMPPERLSQRGATEFGAELSLPLRTETEDAKTTRKSAANRTDPRKS